jgi:hypothetical protein
MELCSGVHSYIVPQGNYINPTAWKLMSETRACVMSLTVTIDVLALYLAAVYFESIHRSCLPIISSDLSTRPSTHYYPASPSLVLRVCVVVRHTVYFEDSRVSWSNERLQLQRS